MFKKTSNINSTHSGEQPVPQYPGARPQGIAKPGFAMQANTPGPPNLKMSTPSIRKNQIPALNMKRLRNVLNTSDFDESFNKILKNTTGSRMGKNISPNLTKSISNPNIAAHTSTQPEHWHFPKKISRVNSRTNSKEDISTSNSFEGMMETGDEHTADSQPADAAQQTPTGTKPKASRQHIQPSTNKKGKRPPPIEIWHDDLFNIVKVLTSSDVPKGSFLINQKNDKVHLIKAINNEVYKKIKLVLTEKNNEFFSYTPLEEKPKNIVLKGIRGNPSEEIVKSEIQSLNLTNVNIIKVTKFIYNRKLPNRHHYIVQLTNNSTTTELMAVRALLYQKTRWEWLRKQAIFQCRRCQRIGHSASNCHLIPRCVKCAGNHEAKARKYTQNTDPNLLKCANCGMAGHPASYHGCLYLKTAKGLLKTKQQQQTANKQNQINTTRAKININTSYAQATKPQQPQKFPQHFPEPPQYSQHTYNNPNQSSELDDLKKWMREEFSKITTQIMINSSRIDYILHKFTENGDD